MPKTPVDLHGEAINRLIAKKNPDPLMLSEDEWAIIREGVKEYDAPTDHMQEIATKLHHKLRRLNDRQVVRLVRDRNT
jgi:hypothetical protein